MEQCKACGQSTYAKVNEHIATHLNPNGEFVKGYGRAPVYKMSKGKEIMACPNCGHKFGEELIEC